MHGWKYRLLVVARIASFVMLIAAPAVSDAQFEPEYSYSLARAKWRRTLIGEVQMVPSELRWKGIKITIGNAWLEKSKVGGCYLCFHLKDGREAFAVAAGNPFFVLDDKEAGVKTHRGRGWMLFVQRLDSENLSGIRLSLIGGWKDERPKNIRFVRNGTVGKKSH